MQNVALEGHFTIEGRERRDGNQELYEVSKVTKLEGDRWRFDVHLIYGYVDANLAARGGNAVFLCGFRDE